LLSRAFLVKGDFAISTLAESRSADCAAEQRTTLSNRDRDIFRDVDADVEPNLASAGGRTVQATLRKSKGWAEGFTAHLLSPQEAEFGRV
jgi:hypothetical protein